MLEIGHRGVAGLEPENTLRSVQRAIDLGFKIIEIDVHFSAGEVIVIHDATLDRTTNGTGNHADWTFEDLRQLDAGNGERIPTLLEILELTEGKATLNIELKGKRVARPVMEIIYGRDDVIISSFDWAQLRIIRSQDEDIRIGILGDSPEAITFAEKINAYSVHPSVEGVDETYVSQAHAADLKVFPHTVTNLKDLVKMHHLDVSGYFANKPMIES